MKTKCAYCQFEGHGYQLRAHNAAYHTLHLVAEVTKVTDQHIIVKLGETQVAVPYSKPKGELIFIKIHGEARFPIIEA